MKIQQLAIKAMLTSKGSVTLLLLVTFLIVFSLNSSGLATQQTTAFTISGKVIGGPTALRARQGGDLVVSLEGNVGVRPANWRVSVTS